MINPLVVSDKKMMPHIETVVLLSHKSPDSVINVKVELGEEKGQMPLEKMNKRAENYKPKEKTHIR